jgi:hypothetical protein
MSFKATTEIRCGKDNGMVGLPVVLAYRRFLEIDGVPRMKQQQRQARKEREVRDEKRQRGRWCWSKIEEAAQLTRKRSRGEPV